MSRIRAWLDASPIADLALALMREATGRADPIEPLRPTRPAALPSGRRVALWSLVGGVGTESAARVGAGAGRATAVADGCRGVGVAPPAGGGGGDEAALRVALIRAGRIVKKTPNPICTRPP